MRAWAGVLLAALLAGCAQQSTSAPDPGLARLGAHYSDGLWWLPDDSVQFRFDGGAWRSGGWVNETTTLWMADANGTIDSAASLDFQPRTTDFEARLTQADRLSDYDAAWVFKSAGSPYFENNTSTLQPVGDAFHGRFPLIGEWSVRITLMQGAREVAKANLQLTASSMWVLHGIGSPGSVDDPGPDEVRISKLEGGHWATAHAMLRPGTPGQAGTDVDLWLIGDDGRWPSCSRQAPSVPPGTNDSNETVSWLGYSNDVRDFAVRIGAMEHRCNDQDPSYHNVGVVPYRLELLVS